EPSHFPRIAVTPASEQVRILVNRTAQSHGYWDDPVGTVRRGDAEMRFVRFFDWDELGQRDLQYVQVRIDRVGRATAGRKPARAARIWKREVPTSPCFLSHDAGSTEAARRIRGTSRLGSIGTR